MWGLLAMLGLKATVGIGTAISDAYYMSSPIGYLEDGTPYYANRNNERFAPNGEKMVSQVAYRADGSAYLKTVGQKTGKVYIDPELIRQKNRDERNALKAENARKDGWLAYRKYDHIRQREITCEISTERYIAELRGEEDGTYWKIYLPDSHKYHQCHYGKKGDKGVQITKEEYDKLNIYGGTHTAFDSNREEWVWDNRKKDYVKKSTDGAH